MMAFLGVLIVVAVAAVRCVGAVEVRMVVIRTVLRMFVFVGVTVVVENRLLLILCSFALFQVRVQRLTRTSLECSDGG